MIEIGLKIKKSLTGSLICFRNTEHILFYRSGKGFLYVFLHIRQRYTEKILT